MRWPVRIIMFRFGSLVVTKMICSNKLADDFDRERSIGVLVTLTYCQSFRNTVNNEPNLAVRL